MYLFAGSEYIRRIFHVSAPETADRKVCRHIFIPDPLFVGCAGEGFCRRCNDRRDPRVAQRTGTVLQ